MSPSALFRALVLGLLGLLSGCSLRPVAHVDLSSLEAPVRVWAGRETAVIRFDLPGNETLYAAAAWTGRQRPDDGAFQHQLATLEPLDNQWPEGLPARSELDELEVLDQHMWNDLLAKVLEALLPPVPNTGLFLVVQQSNIVIYRDADLELRWATEATAPDSVEMTLSYDEPAFVERVARILAHSIEDLLPQRRYLLFRTASLSHPGQLFLLLDLDRGQVVSLNSALPNEGGDPLGLLGLPVRGAASVLFRSHVLTLIKNPFTSLSRLVNMALATTVNFVRPLEWGEGSGHPPLNDGPAMDLAAWETELDSLTSARTYQATVELLIDGEAFFTRLIQDLNRATTRIDFRVYIFDNDDYAVEIADLLRARARDLEVRVLVDDLGTLGAATVDPDTLPPGFSPPESIVDYLERGSPLSVRRATNPWLTADHTKVQIIDRSTAYLGGMNIGREYRHEWHDLMVRLRGPIVGRLADDFDAAWAHAGPGGDLAYGLAVAEDRDVAVDPIPGTISVRPLYTRTGTTEIFSAQLAAIDRANRSIWLQNAYFSDNTVIAALAKARARGVDVRVIIPSDNDSGIMAAANLVSVNALISHGVRVYAYPGMTHVKAAVYDGWACLGSANFDKLSLYINQETNIGFSDPATVEQLRRELFERDFEISREILQPIEPGWSDYLYDLLANQL